MIDYIMALMQDGDSESLATPERIVNPTRIDLSAWTAGKFEEYQKAYAARLEKQIDLDSLADSRAELRNYVNTVAKLMIKKEKSVIDHLSEVGPDRSKMVEQALIEITQNTLEHSFNTETHEWAECSMEIQSLGQEIRIQIKQTTDVPDQVIAQYNDTQLTSDYLVAGITSTTTEGNVVGGAGINLVKSTIAEAGGHLSAVKEDGITIFTLVIPKTN